MVVLEGGGGVVTIGNNQYLQPDYLAPLQTTVSIWKIRKKIKKTEHQKIKLVGNVENIDLDYFVIKNL